MQKIYNTSAKFAIMYIAGDRYILKNKMAKTRFEVYKDKAGTYRWKLLSQNGESVANGGESYASKSGAMNAVRKLKDWSKTTDIVDVEKEAELYKAAAEKVKINKIKAIEKAKADKIKATAMAKAVSSKSKINKAKTTGKKKATIEKTKSGKNSKSTSTKKKTFTKTSDTNNKKDLHIVNRVDRYDGATVADAIDKGIHNKENLLM